MSGRKPSAEGRPHAPRLPDDLAVVDLSTITSGELEQVELVGSLPDDFDEPLLVSQSRIRNASLVGARLERSRFVDVVVTAADLSGADLIDSSWTRVEAHDTRMSGAQLGQARLRDVRWIGCRLDEVSMRLTSAERARFERCRMPAADFSRAQMTWVAWWDCDLTDAEFSQITVAHAELHGSTIEGLRGASALRPIGIDASQREAFAEHVLTAMGIVVSDRSDDGA